MTEKVVIDSQVTKLIVQNKYYIHVYLTPPSGFCGATNNARLTVAIEDSTIVSNLKINYTVIEQKLIPSLGSGTQLAYFDLQYTKNTTVNISFTIGSTYYSIPHTLGCTIPTVRVNSLSQGLLSTPFNYILHGGVRLPSSANQPTGCACDTYSCAIYPVKATTKDCTYLIKLTPLLKSSIPTTLSTLSPKGSILTPRIQTTDSLLNINNPLGSINIQVPTVLLSDRLYFGSTNVSPFSSKIIPLQGNLQSALIQYSTGFPLTNSTYTLESWDFGNNSNSNNNNNSYLSLQYNISPLAINAPFLQQISSPILASLLLYSVDYFDTSFPIRLNDKMLPAFPFGYQFNGSSFICVTIYPPYLSSSRISQILYNRVLNMDVQFTYSQWDNYTFPIPASSPPKLNSIRMEQFDSYSYVLQLQIQSQADFYQAITSDGDIIDYKYLTDGNFTFGTYEILVKMKPTPQLSAQKTYQIIDITSTSSLFIENALYRADLPPLPSPPLFSIDPFKISEFYFQPNNLDISDGYQDTVLYFNLSDMSDLDKYQKPKIQIYFHEHYADEKYIFEGSYDRSLNKFVIPIRIRARLFSGSIKYTLFSYPNPIPNSLLYSIYSIKNQSLLNVTSNFSDNMGPMISDIKSTVPSPLILKSVTVIGWKFTVEDHTGFDYGVARVQSDEMHRPTNFSFSPNGRYFISGDAFSSTYGIDFSIPYPFGNSTFRIDFVLYDILGNMATSFEDFTDKSNFVNPFFNLLSSMVYQQRTIQVFCYQPFPSLQFNWISSLSIRSPTIDVLQTANIELYFNVKYTHPMSTFYQPVPTYNLQPTPIVSRVTYESFSKNITIYGYRLGILGISNSTQVFVNNGSGYKQCPLLFISAPVIVCRYSGDLQSNSRLQVRVIRSVVSGDLTSNEVLAENIQSKPSQSLPTPSPTSTTTTTPCTMQCYNNGVCQNNQCICKPPYWGPNCNSQTIGVPNQPDETSPTIITDNLDNFSSGVSIVELREINPTMEIAARYNLTKWEYQNITNVDDEYQSYSYTTIIYSKPISSIIVTVNYFPKQTEYQFAGKTISMAPNSVKFSITLLPYPFSDLLNSLQVVISTKVQSKSSSDSCSKTEKGEDSGNNLQWINMRINDVSIYGRFIDTAVVDGRNIRIRNTIISESNSAEESGSTTNSMEVLIATTVPSYQVLADIDPDFSVLLNDDELECGKKSNSSNRLIAIIVGSVAGGLVLVSILGLIIFKKFKYQMKIYMASKIERNKKDISLN
ncbi:hypothetical protein PPL_01272 [Heterostelium album PN500]|uniref:EGF-like domain-containing protein n=1 Tax=Heterostelium pallidum (strain ATCC 26659 / Pp 5 / PN500) TaxID=670386 RepID=D3AYL2_HETP5|nr:hypothetical protein PPL_01272 [Heterostelium album PN500]EFA86039.1 hypothetical protein PPL_01272 [Heterostelium album PN500]|eukprot:XP_020438145.1 hypothetical protein PPL_01272 [Heterostelium album PN500]